MRHLLKSLFANEREAFDRFLASEVHVTAMQIDEMGEIAFDATFQPTRHMVADAKYVSDVLQIALRDESYAKAALLFYALVIFQNQLIEEVDDFSLKEREEILKLLLEIRWARGVLTGVSQKYFEVDGDGLRKLFLEKVSSIRKDIAKAGAARRLELDPKQGYKKEVRGWWDKWQTEPARYKSKAAFARAMLDKYPDLESQPVIERWCRDWGSQKHYSAS